MTKKAIVGLIGVILLISFIIVISYDENEVKYYKMEFTASNPFKVNNIDAEFVNESYIYEFKYSSKKYPDLILSTEIDQCIFIHDYIYENGSYHDLNYAKEEGRGIWDYGRLLSYDKKQL